jgi:uncharacterized membrane protein
MTTSPSVPSVGEAAEVEQVDAGSNGGLAPNVAGALSYLFAPVGGVAMYFVGGDDEFVRFHALQGIAFGVALFAFWMVAIVLNVGLSFVLSDIPLVGLLWGLLSFLLYPLIGFLGFVAWAFLTYKAYKGDRFVIPVLGSFASR